MWGWFRPEELHTDPEAPKSGTLVWYYEKQYDVISGPKVLVTDVLTGAFVAGAYGQPFKDGDLICRVMRPEKPQI